MNVIQVVLILTGAFMILCPMALTKRQNRGNAAEVKKTKDMGYWLLFAGIIWLVADYILNTYL